MIRIAIRPLLLPALLLPAFAQAQSDSLVNSVGTYLGSRAAWMKDCSGSLAQEKELAALDPDKACTCMIATLLAAPTVDRSTDPNVLDKLDFNEAVGNDPALMDQFSQCLMTSTIPGVPLSTLGAEKLAEVEHECAAGVRAQAQAQLEAAGVDVDILCACMLRQLVAHDLSLEDLQKAQDPNSPLFNEVMAPCVTEAQVGGAKRADAGVVGPAGPVSVPVTDLGKVHKVKVIIGGTENYFIIDSGANDCFISTSLANELRASGALHDTDRLPDMPYAMADGSQVLCQRYVIQGVTVGPYSVNGVVFAVVDQKIQYLLGKSWLGQFKEWHVDAEKKSLVLLK